MPVEKSDLQETLSLFPPWFLVVLTCLCDSHISLGGWAEGAGLFSSVYRWRNCGSEMGAAQIGLQIQTSLFSQLKIYFKFWSDLYVFVDLTQGLHAPQSSLAKQNLGRSSSEWSTTSETLMSWLLPNVVSGIRLKKKTKKAIKFSFLI